MSTSKTEKKTQKHPQKYGHINTLDKKMGVWYDKADKHTHARAGMRARENSYHIMHALWGVLFYCLLHGGFYHDLRKDALRRYPCVRVSRFGDDRLRV